MSKKFSKWKDAIEVFTDHQKTEYHQFCVIASEHFLRNQSNASERINYTLDSQLQQQIEENARNIKPIIETIVLCGRQGLALRGDNDHGPITSLDEPVCNDGNFRTLLRFRARGGDKNLSDQLLNSGRNKLYTSPSIQNEIINCCNNIILSKLVVKINAAGAFSVLADETADISGTEQVSLCVRYMDCINSVMHEDFLQFIPVYDVTGQGLANVILDNLSKFGIDVNFLRGQGYDGAAAMSGRFRGAQSYVKAKYPLAVYVHCGAHSLNLAISDSCSEVPIRNCIGTISSVYNFFHTPKRQDVLKHAIAEFCPDSRSTKLIQMCPTRWVDRHDSAVIFKELLKPVIEALDIISDWPDRDSSSGAVQLSSSIKTPEFLVALYVTCKIFSLSLPLCKCLQKEAVDLCEACNLANNVLDVLQDMRNHANKEFAVIFTAVTKTCEEFDVPIRVPRISKRQQHRNNIQTEDPESYFRISVFIPFLDSFCQQLKERFLLHSKILEDFMCLLPSVPSERPDENQVKSLERLVTLYASDLDCSNDIAIAEQQLWYRQLAAAQKCPRNAAEAFALCSSNHMPCIRKLLQIMATLPVTTCSSERSFSTLRRLKTYLRNTMGSERLNGLAMMNIHRDIELNLDDIIDKLCEKPRRLPFRLK